MKFAIVFVISLLAYSGAVRFNIRNLNGGPIWIGIQGNPGYDHLANSGFKLSQDESILVYNLMWNEDQGSDCFTGDYGNIVERAGVGGTPPTTVIEITLQGYGGIGYYDISLIEPLNGNGDGGNYSCRKAQCGTNITQICPGEFQIWNPERSRVIACNVIYTDEYCCAGAHSTPETCRSSGTVRMKFAVVFLVSLLAYSEAVRFNIRNLDGGPIWIGIQGNPGHDHLANGGFKLSQGESRSLDAADDWAGRFWSRTWCYEDQGNHCYTGDCGNKVECAGAGGTPPTTLIEITLKGYGGIDYYDISLVDGYNSMASIEPVNGNGDGGEYSCRKAQCGTNINQICPGELQIWNPEGSQVIACNSACNAFHTDEYCCAGAHSTPETCKSSDWPVNYPEIFKNACPDAYSYAYDDHKSTFTCQAGEYNLNFGSA
ncbi:hypothetical protein GWI33_010620 [Rhynchophorus ferrugineus]|uniref:Thaumatin-like protein n=1 Tax=Rhynchophorus ferrugineus TaxID=354439 RepID=A0A834MIV7_RHYFE|nr:hypothetical protein GWI33_010620 [Rhynchophorus ferrugineus]